MQKTRFEYARYGDIRQCEYEMRRILRDMKERRTLIDRLQKIAEARYLGRMVNEIEFERCRVRRNELDRTIRPMFKQLYVRMGRLLAQSEKTHFSRQENRRRKANGDGTHAQAH